jgi:hypothetical protein
MKRSPLHLVHILLSTATLTDAERADLVTSITQNAPQADLYKSQPPIQAAVATLATAGAAFTKTVAAVAATEGLLVSQKETRDNDRASLDRALALLSALVQNSATTDADAKAIGLRTFQRQAKSAVVTPPDGVIVKPAKAHGKFTATAHDLLGRQHFATQLSPDPVTATSWVDLPGNGKQRRLSGYPSGSTQWVRFAALRGQERSAWCAPVAVVVP